MSTRISAVIITYNEAKNIGRCIESLADICNEIIVVDSYSTDNTVLLAEQYGAKVLQRKWDNYIDQKNFGNEQAKGDYILSMDADEYLSPALREKLKDSKSFESYDIISFNRLNNYIGKWMRHGEWYPDKKVRLWRKGCAKWGGSIPHETVLFNSDLKSTHIALDILHITHQSIDEHILKSSKYALLSTDQVWLKSAWTLWFKLLFSGVFRFFKSLILWGGILDGWRGIVGAGITSIGVTYKYWLALERKVNT